MRGLFIVGQKARALGWRVRPPNGEHILLVRTHSDHTPGSMTREAPHLCCVELRVHVDRVEKRLFNFNHDLKRGHATLPRGPCIILGPSRAGAHRFFARGLAGYALFLSPTMTSARERWTFFLGWRQIFTDLGSAFGALLNIVRQPRTLLCPMDCNAWMGTAARADELVEIPTDAHRPLGRCTPFNRRSSLDHPENS